MKLWPLALIVFGIVLAVASIYQLAHPSTDRVTGKLTFDTEAEYSEFKTLLSNESVKYGPQDVSALSSEPPIVVSFSVTIPHELEFPYEVDRSIESNAVAQVVLVLGGFMVIAGIALWLM